MAFPLGHNFCDKVGNINETLLTRLTNGNASHYVATFKGKFLSKVFTCMELFLLKQKLLFYQEDGYL